MLVEYGSITTLPFSEYASPIVCAENSQWETQTTGRPENSTNNNNRDDFNNKNPVSTLTDAAQHMVGKKLFCELDCSQAYHCLRNADKRTIEGLAFNFASRTFANRRLAQGLSRALSAFFSFDLDRVLKTDQCAQYVDNFGIAANDVDQLTKNLRSTFECIREAGLKLTMNKCHFGASLKNNFLGTTITPEGVKLQKERITNFQIPEVQDGLAALSWIPLPWKNKYHSSNALKSIRRS